MKTLHNKSDEVPFGLESLSSLLRYEPGHYGTKWLRLEAEKWIIGPALPERTPYQLQYLVLFGFGLPSWQDIPLVTKKDRRIGAPSKVMGNIERTALLYGKNEQLYLVTATWAPTEGYFGGGKEPWRSTSVYTFRLSHLMVEIVDWQDARILERITSGHWSDVTQFKGNLHLVLEASASVLEGRAHVLRKAADLFDLDGMSIYSGR